jgi:dipeptidyl aminopeptidase/acylaminoacyl peptidase
LGEPRSGRAARPPGFSRLEADGGTPFISSRTLDDSVWLVYLEQDHKSPKFYRWTRATQTAELLFSVQPALDRQPLVKYRPVVIPARDGLPLLSYLSLPAAADADDDGQPETPLPLVLVVHGGPWGRDEWGAIAVALGADPETLSLRTRERR